MRKTGLRRIARDRRPADDAGLPGPAADPPGENRCTRRKSAPSPECHYGGTTRGPISR